MDYFCYISQNKVDQLLGSFEKGEQLEWSEQVGENRERQGKLGLENVLSILNADISYGRSDMFQRNEKLKRTYVQKLKTLLRHLTPSIDLFQWREPAGYHSPIHYFLRASFKVKDLDEMNLIAILESQSGPYKLILDCSLKYFSDEPVSDNRVRVTSTNYRFFQAKVPVTFETVFLLLHTSEGVFYGSPLFLKLSSQDGLVI